MSHSHPNPPEPSAANVDLQVDDSYLAATPEAQLLAVVEATLRREGAVEAELTLVVTGDELLQQLNRDYRGIDAPTDVLSFSAQEDAEDGGPAFVTAPEAEAYLGDVIISYPMAERQAAAVGHPVQDELCLLAVHGVLHLLGYDHATPEEEAVMWAIQDEILHKP